MRLVPVPRWLLDLATTVTILLVGYALLAEEWDSWRGVLIIGLVVVGAIELIVTGHWVRKRDLSWTTAAHGLIAGLAVVVGIALAPNWRWLVLAAFMLGLVVAKTRWFPDPEDAADGDQEAGRHS